MIGLSGVFASLKNNQNMWSLLCLAISFISLLISAANTLDGMSSIWHLSAIVCWGIAGFAIGYASLLTLENIRKHTLVMVTLVWSTAGLIWSIFGPFLFSAPVTSIIDMEVMSWLIRGSVLWGLISLSTVSVLREPDKAIHWISPYLELIAYTLAGFLALSVLLSCLRTIEYSVIGFCSQSISRLLHNSTFNPLLMAAVASGTLGAVAGGLNGGVISSSISVWCLRKHSQLQKKLLTVFLFGIEWSFVWLIGIIGYNFIKEFIIEDAKVSFAFCGENCSGIFYLVSLSLGATLLLGISGWLTGKILRIVTPTLTAKSIWCITKSWLIVGVGWYWCFDHDFRTPE